MKFLVTGSSGQLGQDVLVELKNCSHEVLGVDIGEMDITDENVVFKTIKAYSPDVVIHCGAWTAVDLAEDEENKTNVYAVNVLGTDFISKACAEIDAKLVYISTDYVFDGEGEKPWQPDDLCEPINYYGKTKYEGELAVLKHCEKCFIVRISWVFGMNGNNFVNTMLRLGKEKDSLTVVDDQIGTPTFTPDLAKILVDMALSDKYGKYHVTNEGGYISWFDFAREIFKIAYENGKDEYSAKNLEIIPVDSSAYPAKAKRPSNSRLDKSKLMENGFEPLPTWQNALERYLKEYFRVQN